MPGIRSIGDRCAETRAFPVLGDELDLTALPSLTSLRLSKIASTLRLPPSIRQLDLSGAYVFGLQLQGTGLHILNIHDSCVEYLDTFQLAKQVHLQHLVLCESDDPSLPPEPLGPGNPFADLHELQTVKIGHLAYSIQLLEHVSGMPALRSVDLDVTMDEMGEVTLTPTVLEHLSELPGQCVLAITYRYREQQDYDRNYYDVPLTDELMIALAQSAAGSLTSLFLDADGLGVDGLSALASFTRLKSLELRGVDPSVLLSCHDVMQSQVHTRITSMAIHGNSSGVSQLVNLRRVELLHQLSPTDVSEITSLYHLSHLRIAYSHNEIVMQPLCSLPSVHSLSVYHQLDESVPSDFLRFLSNNCCIEELILEIRFNDWNAALQLISRIPSLRELRVSHTLTNRQFVSLLHAPKLVTVMYTPSTDEALYTYRSVDMEAMREETSKRSWLNDEEEEEDAKADDAVQLEEEEANDEEDAEEEGEDE